MLLTTPRSVFLTTFLFVSSAACDRPREPVQEVTAERLAAAFRDARTALESAGGFVLDPQLELRIVASDELAERVAAENLPAIRLRELDESAAEEEARALGDVYAKFTFAKYAWSTREVLVVPEVWERLAEALGRPVLTSDEVLRAVLVHELVHAHDDAIHDLAGGVGRSDSLDAIAALSAVIEGHAQYEARRICAQRGWTPAFEAFTDAVGAIPPEMKELGEAMLMLARVQSETFVSQYRDGERFIAALVEAGGPDAVARAFRDPPREGALIAHPEWYLDPSLRPPSLYDLEPALDRFALRFPEDAWSGERATLQPGQIGAALGLLPAETTESIQESLRANRVVALQSVDEPESRMVVLCVLEFETDVAARSYVDAVRELSRLKDEAMKTGLVRIVVSRTEDVTADDAYGFLQEKTIEFGGEELGVWGIDLARGELVVETIFTNERIEPQDHEAFAAELLDSMPLLEEREESR